MDRILMKFNDAAYNEELKHANLDLVEYNNFLGVLQANVPEFVISIGNVTALLANPVEFAFDAVVGNNPLTIGGAPVNKQKAMDIIDMPQKWVTVIAAANNLLSDFKVNTVYKLTVRYAMNGLIGRLAVIDFDMVDSKFVLSAAFLANLNDKHSTYTQNDKQVKIYTDLKGILDLLVDLQQYGVLLNPSLSLEDFGFTMGLADPSKSDRYSFNPDFITRF